MDHRKDASLDKLARWGNVAQFVSYEPIEGQGRQTFARIRGYEPNHTFASLEEAVQALLNAAPDASVNVRSYTPDSPRSREFVYGLIDAGEAVGVLRRLLAEGLHVIVNETVDVRDGGVSGVVQGGVMEFAPDDTPRCVEKPGVASLPVETGMDLLETVYGFRPELPADFERVEFSIHPKPRGWHGTRTLLWELEEGSAEPAVAHMAWPNRFSRHLGDKAYGLVMAHLAGMAVPRTLVVPRRVAPFSFGTETETGEVWVRTCPTEQEPGLFTTRKGWTDPFALIAAEDPGQDRIASILSQSAVPATHSGAALVDGEGRIVVEGVSGEGDRFMLGSQSRADLPENVVSEVSTTMDRLSAVFGPTRIEWVHDGMRTWIVQLHVGATSSTSTVLVPGERASWVDFEVGQGLESLRRLLSDVDGDTGVRLRGRIGMTSHIADLVRKSGVPTRIAGGGSNGEA